MDKHGVRFWRIGWVACLGTLFLLPTLQGASLPDTLAALRKKAEGHVEGRQWASALDLYLRIPRTERTDKDREYYQLCLRHVLQARRLRDKPSQLLIPKLEPSQALNVYVDVLKKLQARYVDRERVDLAMLFVNGVLELRFALEDEAFLKEHLPSVKAEALDGFRDRLARLIDDRPSIRSLDEAREELKRVQVRAQQELGLRPAVVMLEFICGACNALDEFTLYLSPRQLLQAEADQNGKYVGVGIDVGVFDERLLITRVLPKSPAEQAGLAKGYRILGIDGQPVDPSAPAASAARLQGEPGTWVVLDIERSLSSEPDMPGAMSDTVRLQRRQVDVPSIEAAYELEDEMQPHTGVGYVKLASFQRNTPDELKDVILKLDAEMRSRGSALKALVLDLRGNLGGSFPAALQVVELFLPEGVIVYTQTRSKEEALRANNPQALLLPLVLLVDGETASAAEVVAGALKEHGRATLVGQTTYGKCSIQCVVRLDSIKSGIQITVARFASPTHTLYDGHGVTPHRLVERTLMTDADLPRAEALRVAEAMLKMMPR